MRRVQRIQHSVEAGFVSLFSVIFFMLLVTVITVGFLRVMNLEQRQSIDNELAASAYAAAQSGVEDAKRAILRYHDPTTPAPLRTALQNALSSSSCDAFKGSAQLQTELGIDPDGKVTGGTATGSNQINQEYTCLVVNLNTPDYLGDSTAGKSDFIPLRTTAAGGYNEVKVSWHLLSNAVGEEGDGVPANYAPGILLPPVTGGAASWSSQGYPAYLRLQIYGHRNAGSINRAELTDRTRTIMLVPSIGGAATINFEDDQKGGDPAGFDLSKDIIKPVQCVANPAGNIGSYACSTVLAMPTTPGQTPSENNYYLRVTPVYGSTHFRIALQNNGTPVNMSEVQPLIDATGKAEDVLRRIQVRVRLNSNFNLPEYAVESAETICKNLEVADGSYYRANNCP